MNSTQRSSPTHHTASVNIVQHQYSMQGVGALHWADQLHCNIGICYLAIIVTTYTPPGCWINCLATHKIILPSWRLKAFLFFLMMTRGRMVGKCTWPPVLDREQPSLVHLGNYSDPADHEHVLTLAVRRHSCVWRGAYCAPLLAQGAWQEQRFSNNLERHSRFSRF